MIKSESNDDGDHSSAAAAETSGTAPTVQEHDEHVDSDKNEQQKLKRVRATTDQELSLLYEHFITLDHYYVGKNGNPQSHRACVCKHCKSTGEAEELARYRKALENHLENCRHYREALGPAGVKKRSRKSRARKSLLAPSGNSSVEAEGDTDVPGRRPAYERMQELETIKEFLTPSEYAEKRQAILDSI
jgi:hypothetical protein